jgi:DNA replication protein DnaC
MIATTTTSGRNLAAELAYLTRVLKAPSLAASVERLAERARAESWSHEEFLAACLQREVAARESHGGEARIRAARFPARKGLEDFDFDHQRSLKREVIAHLGTLDFVAGKENVVFLGPPGTGKTHLSIGLGIRACQAGHRVAFATAAVWVARLADAHAAGKLQDELTKLARIPVLIVDEVGYIPFEPEAANLFFQLVSSRYERASLIVTSNKPFGKAHMFARTCARWCQKVTGSVTRAPLRLGSRTGVRPLAPRGYARAGSAPGRSGPYVAPEHGS